MKRAAAVAAALLAAIAPLARAASTEIEVKPGPKVMLPEEKSITADVAKGSQHGVILLEEAFQNDDIGTNAQLDYHMRAKILSPEGRGLADIAIPVERGTSDLKTFWGRTILPDGSVLELPQSELKVQSVVKSSMGSQQELKGALPGVVPGCVIDYGYVLRSDAGFSRRIFLQKEWPVRSIRYRWVPSRYAPAAYVTSRAEGRAIKVVHDNKSVLVTGQDLDPVPDEPDMPPLDSVRASATLYYTNTDDAKEYWEHSAKRIDGELKTFVGGGGAIKDALAEAGIPAGAPLAQKLQAAYEWLGKNVKNTFLMSAEEEESDEKRDNEAYNARTVLAAKKASPRQMDYLFAGMARALGAEANIVFAADRTDRFWNKSFKSMEQFDYAFVAVHVPGASGDPLVFVDAGSGLPYGQLPWRATGASALLCSAKGSSIVLIPVPSPATNRSDTHVTLAFSDDNETMTAKWARTANGAGGMDYRRWLRDLDPRERKEKLDRICGASGSTEVSAAELPELEEVSAPFQIACDTEKSDMRITEDTGSYSLHVSGPWWPDTPEFTAATRVHPVLFKYPRADIVGIDVEAPHGFTPKDPPAAIELTSPYGRYQLSVTKTPTGFHVDRAFALTVLVAKTEEYAAVRKFFEDVGKADETTVSFVRHGEAK